MWCCNICVIYEIIFEMFQRSCLSQGRSVGLLCQGFLAHFYPLVFQFSLSSWLWLCGYFKATVVTELLSELDPAPSSPRDLPRDRGVRKGLDKLEKGNEKAKCWKCHPTKTIHSVVNSSKQLSRCCWISKILMQSLRAKILKRNQKPIWEKGRPGNLHREALLCALLTHKSSQTMPISREMSVIGNVEVSLAQTRLLPLGCEWFVPQITAASSDTVVEEFHGEGKCIHCHVSPGLVICPVSEGLTASPPYETKYKDKEPEHHLWPHLILHTPSPASARAACENPGSLFYTPSSSCSVRLLSSFLCKM